MPEEPAPGTSTGGFGFGPPEQQYCAEQIQVPPKLPALLKEYTKAAIRTQPPDLLAWSASYFAALSTGDTLPVKHRIELPNVVKDALTETKLTALHRQLGENEVVTAEIIRERWFSVGAGLAILESTLLAGGWADDINWLEFLVLCCGWISSTVQQAMLAFCRIYSDDDAGGAARIPIGVFVTAYSWLASMDSNIGKKRRNDVTEYLQGQASLAAGMIGPRNIEHKDCPRLA